MAIPPTPRARSRGRVSTGRIMGWSAILSTALLAAVGQAALTAGPAYKVAPVTFDLSASDTVGAKRSGSLCLPAGGVAWRDAKPDAIDAREAVTQAARRAGLNVGAADNPFEEGVTGFDRAIRVQVRGMHLTACVPPGGLGRLVNRSHLIKGDGVIAIEWRVYARGQDDPLMTGHTCTAFNYRGDPGALTDMTLEGLRSATGRFVAGLMAGKAEPVAIEDEACRRLGRVRESSRPDENAGS